MSLPGINWDKPGLAQIIELANGNKQRKKLEQVIIDPSSIEVLQK